MVWAKIALMAKVLIKVDLPEALEPVIKTLPSAEMELGTGEASNGWYRSKTFNLGFPPF